MERKAIKTCSGLSFKRSFRGEEKIKNNPPNHTLLVFVKYPEPGKVKTRLAQDIGKQRAAEIYSAMAKTVIGQVLESDECETIIFFDPPERKADVENWLQSNGHKLLPQEGASLGERMSNAFRSAFSLGADKSVIIGTDCVEISGEIIREAFAELETADAVLGPADDGGYYLLGLKRAIPEIFDGIEWSTNLVLSQTVKKLREKGLEFQLLQTLKDVDTINDINDELLLKIQGE